MDVVTLSSTGQVAVPSYVRKRLHVDPGDDIVFAENTAGDIVMLSRAASELLEAQRSFHAQSPVDGFEREEQLDAFVAAVRTERGGLMPA